MVGEEFGSYKIVRKLGEGGMGEVYLARHVFMDRPAGIAKLAYPGSVSKTATGSILGTPLYMSPEQGRGLAKVDFRSDIYSLGCIIFEMLCGRPPFVREAPGDLIIAHATEAPPRMSTLVDGVPPDLERLVDRLLEKAPDARPQSMAEVVAALRPIQRMSSTRGLDAASGVPSSRDDARADPLDAGAWARDVHALSPSDEGATAARGGGTLRLPPDDSVPPPFAVGGTKLLPADDVSLDARARFNPASGPRRVPNTTLSSTASQSIPLANGGAPGRRSLSTILGLVLAAGLGVGGTYLWARRAHTGGAPALNPATAEGRNSELAPTAAPPAALPRVAEAAVPEPRKHHSRTHRDLEESASSKAPDSSQTPEGGSSFDQARSAYAHADYITSLRLAKRAVREGIGIPAYILVGQSYERLERLDEAADAYRSALAVDPSDTTASKLLRHLEKTK